MALIVPSRTLPNKNVFRPEFVDNRLEFCRDGVERLVPGDPLPFPAELVADLLHGVDYPVRMVGQLQDGHALGAHGSLGDRGIRIPLHLYRLAVLHVNDHAAGPMTTTTMGFDLFYFCHF